MERDGVFAQVAGLQVEEVEEEFAREVREFPTRRGAEHELSRVIGHVALVVDFEIDDAGRECVAGRALCLVQIRSSRPGE